MLPVKPAQARLLLLLLAQICQAVGRYICMHGREPLRLDRWLNLLCVNTEAERRQAAHQHRHYRQILVVLFLGQARCVLRVGVGLLLALALNLPMLSQFHKSKNINNYQFNIYQQHNTLQ